MYEVIRQYRFVATSGYPTEWLVELIDVFDNGIYPGTEWKHCSKRVSLSEAYRSILAR